VKPSRLRFLIPLLGWLMLAHAHAQTAAAPVAAGMPSMPVTEPDALQPFIATYQVFNNGRQLGDATLQLVANDGNRWRIDLLMKGHGLMRLTGLNVQQSTVFERNGQSWRPLSQSTLRRVGFSSRKSTGVYDWNGRQARWSGDIKPHRAGPVALRDGDLSGLLINLAVIRDAQPGKALHYRFVDGGRIKEHAYQVAPDTEAIQVGELRYDAMRVDRVQGGGENTTLWVASGVPTPIRILQRENSDDSSGQDSTDLRLIQYQGVP